MRSSPLRRCTAAARLAVIVSLAAAVPAAAQVREPEDTLSAGENAGTLSDVSRRLADDRLPVHSGTQTIGESTGGSMRSNPMHDADTRTMLSGPVSEMSRGPMTERRPPVTTGAVAEASAGAVTHDIASPLGERISQPLRELGPLQKQMRAQRQQAEQEALRRAMEPAVPAADDEATAQPDTTAPAAADLRAGPEVAPELGRQVDQDAAQHTEDAPAPDDADPSD